MSLTRSMLTDMRLDEDSIAAILRAHESTVAAHRAGWEAELLAARALREAAAECDALRARIAELEQAQQRADAIRAEFDAYRQQQADAQLLEEKHRLLRRALVDAGANEQLTDLLLKEIDPEQAQLEDGRLLNAEELIRPLCEKWSACFASIVHIPAPRIAPPLADEAPIPREILAAMRVDDVNRHWDDVQQSLRSHP